MSVNSFSTQNANASARGVTWLPLQYLALMASAIGIGVLFYASSQRPTVAGAPAAPTEATPTPSNNTIGATSGTQKVQATQTVSDIVTDALAFYNMLTTAQQSTLQLSYTTSLARKWSNLPCGTTCRNGLQLGTNLTSAQYAAAMQVAKDALGAGANDGYDEFHQMNLAEAYLHANGGGSGYDSTLRWMAFLNTPTTTGAWMLQFGGHHYAANIAFNNGHVVGATPFFMGLEPKTFTYNSVAYDPLGDERTALANMLASLSSSELSTAAIASAFSDCVMIPGETNGGASSFPAIAIGQSVGNLTSTQQNLVLEAIQHYTDDMDTATAQSIQAVYASEIASSYISYHGSGTAGSASSFLVAQGDYARISGPHVWIEFSCQGGIVIQGQIHFHTVWRDRAHDYGVDLTGDPIDVSGATAVAAEVGGASIMVYPNPASDHISIALPASVNDATISVISGATGQVALETKHFSGTLLNEDISGLSTGMYLLRVQSAAGANWTGKFIKR